MSILSGRQFNILHLKGPFKLRNKFWQFYQQQQQKNVRQFSIPYIHGHFIKDGQTSFLR